MTGHPGIRVVAAIAWFLLATAAAAGEDFGGIGAAVVPVSTGELVVVNVLAGSPAQKGGLLPGDLIVRVDERSLLGSDFSEVVTRHLWGPPGNPVSLVYRRPGQTGEHTVTLRRVPMKPTVGQTPGVQWMVPAEDARKKEEGR